MAPAVEGNGDKDSLSSALNDRFSLTYIPRVFQAVTIPPPFLRRTLTFEMLGKRRGKTSWWGKDVIQDTMMGDKDTIMGNMGGDKGNVGDSLGILFKGAYTDKGQHEKNRIEEKNGGNKTGNKGKTNNDTINTINNNTSNTTSNTTTHK